MGVCVPNARINKKRSPTERVQLERLRVGKPFRNGTSRRLLSRPNVDNPRVLNSQDILTRSNERVILPFFSLFDSWTNRDPGRCAWLGYSGHRCGITKNSLQHPRGRAPQMEWHYTVGRDRASQPTVTKVSASRKVCLCW